MLRSRGRLQRNLQQMKRFYSWPQLGLGPDLKAVQSLISSRQNTICSNAGGGNWILLLVGFFY